LPWGRRSSTLVPASRDEGWRPSAGVGVPPLEEERGQGAQRRGGHQRDNDGRRIGVFGRGQRHVVEQREVVEPADRLDDRAEQVDDQRPDDDGVDRGGGGAGRERQDDGADAEHEQRGRHDVEAGTDRRAQTRLDGCAQPISSHDDDRRFTWRSLSSGAHSRRSGAPKRRISERESDEVSSERLGLVHDVEVITEVLHHRPSE
jgi:hypothetical protein